MTGPSDVDPQVGEFIYGPRYRYTIATVTSTTVTATERTDLKGPTGAAGANAIQAVLSNESHTLPANSSGTPTTYTGASTTITVYEGTTDVTSQWTITKTDPTGISSTLSDNTVTVTSVTNGTGGNITITATKGSTTLTKLFNISIAKAGTNGTSPTAYNLIVSHAAIAKSQAGVYNPTSLTFSATSQTGNGAISTYTSGSYRITKDGGTAGSWTNLSSSNTYNVTSNAPTTSVKIELAKENASSSTHTIVDAQTVPIVKDGKGISSITNYYLATSASSGVTRDTSGWTTTVQTMTETNKYLWNYEDILYNDNSHTYSDPTIIGVYGATGAAGKGISAIDEYYAINNSSTTAPADADFSTTVVSPTASNPYLWNYEKITYVNPSSTENTAKHIIGHYGKDGTNGTSPFIAYLTNESQTFVYGTTTTITSQLYAYQGTTEKNVTIKSVNGVTASTSETATGNTGMKFKVSSTSAVAHPTISFITDSNLPQSQTKQMAIVYQISGEGVDKTLYFNYSTTTRGENAKLVVISPSAQVFKSTEGASGTFLPNSIVLTPRFQNVSYTHDTATNPTKGWFYDRNDGQGYKKAIGANGVSINSSSGVLTLQNTSTLFTDIYTSITFKLISSDTSVIDTVTISKIYDVTDIEIGGTNLISNLVSN